LNGKISAQFPFKWAAQFAAIIPGHALKHGGMSSRSCMGMESTMSELLTVAEFKDRYKISHSAFYREVAAKRISIRKIGRSTRIALADAEAWAANLPTSTD